MKTLFKDKKWWLETLKILIIGIIINIACIFMCSITGHCANLDGNSYFPFQSGETTGTVYVNDTFIQEQFEDGAWFIYVHADPSSSYPYRTRYDVLKNVSTTSPDPNLHLYGELMSNNSHFSLYWSTSSQVSCEVYYYLDWGDGREIDYYTTDSNTLRPYYNLNSALNNDDIAYYTKKNVTYLSTDEVLIYAPVEEVPIGEFTDLPNLDEILNNIQNNWEPPSTTTGHALPNTPQENTNNTPFQDRLQMFQYLADTITQNIGNLGYNLQNFFNKLYEKLTNVGNAISTNIYNGFSTLMQNIKDFFGPKLDKIIDLLSQLQNNANTDMEENWDDSQVKQDFDSISQSVQTSFSVWSDTSEPTEFKIPLHVENVAILNCNQVQYIDLGLFSPVLPYIRSIMWALMVYSLVYTIIDSFASYLSGGDE